MGAEMLKHTMIAAIAAGGLTTAAHAAVFDFNDAAFLDTTVDSVTTADGSIVANLTTVRGTGGNATAGIAAIFDTENAANAPSNNDSDGDRDLVESGLNFGQFQGTGFGGALIVSETGTTAGVALRPADDNAGGGSITFSFIGTLVNLISVDILDDATITVTSADSTAVVSHSVAANNGFGVGFDLSAFSNVSSVKFDFNGASGAIDNFTVAAVPVPAALPLLLAGLGGLGLMRRRRKAS